MIAVMKPARGGREGVADPKELSKAIETLSDPGVKVTETKYNKN